jgi:CheY-like chemotaxis protein
VTTFPSADEAWPWLADETHRVDLVLTDLTMPGMSGRELLRRTRALRPDVRGVLMSGNAELGGHDAEPDPFVVLEKPFLTSELLDALDRVLAG